MSFLIWLAALILRKTTLRLLLTAGFQIIQVQLSETVYVLGEGGGISLGLFFGIAGIGTGVGPIIARWITGDEDRPMRWGIAVGWVIGGLGMWIAASLISFPVVLLGTFLRGVGGGVVWVFSTQLLLQKVLLTKAIRFRFPSKPSVRHSGCR